MSWPSTTAALRLEEVATGMFITWVNDPFLGDWAPLLCHHPQQSEMRKAPVFGLPNHIQGGTAVGCAIQISGQRLITTRQLHLDSVASRRAHVASNQAATSPSGVAGVNLGLQGDRGSMTHLRLFRMPKGITSHRFPDVLYHR